VPADWVGSAGLCGAAALTPAAFSLQPGGGRRRRGERAPCVAQQGGGSAARRWRSSAGPAAAGIKPGFAAGLNPARPRWARAWRSSPRGTPFPCGDSHGIPVFTKKARVYMDFLLVPTERWRVRRLGARRLGFVRRGWLPWPGRVECPGRPACVRVWRGRVLGKGSVSKRTGSAAVPSRCLL